MHGGRRDRGPGSEHSRTPTWLPFLGTSALLLFSHFSSVVCPPVFMLHDFHCSGPHVLLSHQVITIAIDLGIYIFTWIRIFEKLERRRVFGRSTPVVVKQIPRLFTLSCLLSWLFLQPHRTAHRHLDHELLKMVIMFVFIEKTIADSRIPGGQDPTLPS